MANAISVEAISDADWADFYVSVLRENARRETLANARKKALEAAKAYEDALKAHGTPEAKPIKNLDETAVVGPGERVIVDGVTWENVSGAWISPFSAGPVNYPQGWKRAGADAVNADGLPAWKADQAYKTGDQVSYDGVAYKCVQAHKSQVGWEPSAVTALWAKA